MRFSAFIPIILTAGALVLSFLCLFAGRNPSFMQGYEIVSLNTSRIGDNLLNDTESESSSNPIANIFHHITNKVDGELNDAADSLAKKLGLKDVYVAHVLDYCEGYYTPSAVPNATVSKHNIHKNITDCSSMKALYYFDPTTAIEQSLNSSKTGVTLDDLHWPQAIQKGIDALRIAYKVMFVTLCIGIGCAGVAFLLSVIAIFATGRFVALVNVMVAFIGFLALGISAGIATGVAVKVAHEVNKYGKAIGVSASKGDKFLAMIWVATGVMLISSLIWCFDCIVGHRRRAPKTAEKDAY